jgi:hypothetical protein
MEQPGKDGDNQNLAAEPGRNISKAGRGVNKRLSLAKIYNNK